MLVIVFMQVQLIKRKKMFLNRLNSEEKVAFLELAHHVARSDGEFTKDEKSVVEGYCFEMQIEDVEYSEKNFELSKLLAVFENKMSQKVLLLELMALVYSDNKVDSKEQKIIDTIVQSFTINSSLAKIYEEWTKTILSVSAQGALLLEV